MHAFSSRLKPECYDGALFQHDFHHELGFERIYLQRMKPQNRNNWHDHPGVQLIMIYFGAGKLFIREHGTLRSETLQTGDAILIPARRMHLWQIERSEGCDALAINFSEQPTGWELSCMLLQLESAGVLQEVLTEKKELMDALQDLYLLQQKKAFGWRLELLRKALEIVTRLAECATLRSGTQEQIKAWPTQYVQKAKLYMLQHYAEPLTLEKIAQHLDLSVSHLVRLFRIQGEVSPMQHLMQLRIEAARRMLNATAESASVIARKVGLTNIQYFSRVFKNVTGQTPSTFRKRLKISTLE